MRCYKVINMLQASSEAEQAATPEWAAAVLQKGQQGAAAVVDVVVAKGGSGNFESIMAAIDAAPRASMTRHVVRLAKGVYDEIVRVPEDVWNLTLLGDGIGVTVVTGSRAFDDGYSMPETATVGMYLRVIVMDSVVVY